MTAQSGTKPFSSRSLGLSRRWTAFGCYSWFICFFCLPLKRHGLFVAPAGLFFPVWKEDEEEGTEAAMAGKDGTMPGAMEFVISRHADWAELAIRLRVLINNEVLLPDHWRAISFWTHSLTICVSSFLTSRPPLSTDASSIHERYNRGTVSIIQLFNWRLDGEFVE